VISIASLFVYPVKSCRGIALDRACMTATGLQHDREWMVVTPEGRFLTQREYPRLALIVPSFVDDASLRLEAPGLPALDVPLHHARNGADHREVTVWRAKCLGWDEGDTAARWLTRVLGREVRLVRFDPARRRPVDDGFEGSAMFSDGFPVLVLSQASLDDLNTRLEKPLPVNRFRPNVLLAGCEPYEEDRIATITAGAVRLRNVKACTRCVITTTNQARGEVEGDEPLRTLKTYRWDRALRGIAFAQNAIVEAGIGEEIAVGMTVKAQAAGNG
jgi:uncharacterized protein YcbX